MRKSRLAIARKLGASAGRRYARTGIPVRNPFAVAGREELAAAWRAGYFGAVTSGGSR